METSFFFGFAKGLLFLIPQLAVLAACIYYFIRQKSADSILLALGSLVGAAVAVFYDLLLPILQRTGSFDFIYLGSVFTIVGFISFAGHAAFAVGLFLLILKYIRLIKNRYGN